jgi:hypothetical protein
MDEGHEAFAQTSFFRAMCAAQLGQIEDAENYLSVGESAMQRNSNSIPPTLQAYSESAFEEAVKAVSN